jgi:hypothetical protein
MGQVDCVGDQYFAGARAFAQLHRNMGRVPYEGEGRLFGRPKSLHDDVTAIDPQANAGGDCMFALPRCPYLGKAMLYQTGCRDGLIDVGAPAVSYAKASHEVGFGPIENLAAMF